MSYEFRPADSDFEQLLARQAELLGLNRLARDLEGEDLLGYSGWVTRIVGTLVEGTVPGASVGTLCRIFPQAPATPILAEVVGFKERLVLLMAYGESRGITHGSRIEPVRSEFSIGVGNGLLGRVVDVFGKPLDDGPPIVPEAYAPVYNESVNPMERKRISQPLDLGVRAINGLLTVGMGQRMGIFAGSGVGKSTLLGMVARNTSADVIVLGLVGERGREVREFIERDLGPEGLKRSVVVVVTADKPAVLRVKGCFVATAIAEHFSRQGKNVLLLVDSVTRFAMAQREIGLAAGEPPASKGYTPSVFAMLPRMFERVGNFERHGSITGIYTVLVEGDDLNDPVVDATRAILDGHIVLSREIAYRNHFPAIDVLKSISRVMSDITTPAHRRTAGRLKELLATYRDAEDLINIGAYKKGNNPRIDEAILHIPAIHEFLRQQVDEKVTYEDTLTRMGRVIG